MTDLIERLRDRSTWRDAFHRCIIQPELLTEAADELTALRERVAAAESQCDRMREALALSTETMRKQRWALEKAYPDLLTPEIGPDA